MNAPVPTASPNRISTPVAIAILGVLTACLASVVMLVIAGRPTDTVITLIATVIVPTVSVLFLGSRVDKVAGAVDAAAQTASDNNDKLENVGKALNGNLDAKFRDLERRLLANLSEPDSNSESPPIAKP